MLRFGAGAAAGGVAAVSGTPVERFADSAVAGEVSVGCAGGGWRRSATGLREAQPEELRQRTQRAQRGKNRDLRKCLREQDFRVEIRLSESRPKQTDSGEFFKGPPVS